MGEPSVGQGSRTDIKELTQKYVTVKLRWKIVCLIIQNFMFGILVLLKMFNAVMKPRESPPEVIWRWGLAGTGKTRYCIEKHPSHYIKDGTSWWDNYTQQEAIIIDDFDNNIPYRTLLRIIDRYSCQGQVKGSYVQINSPFIYITCEHPPEKYWSDNELKQILRRITSVQEIK